MLGMVWLVSWFFFLLDLMRFYLRSFVGIFRKRELLVIGLVYIWRCWRLFGRDTGKSVFENEVIIEEDSMKRVGEK